MRTLTLLTLLAAAGPCPADPPEGFEPLFDGRGLAGWQILGRDNGAWKAEDGLLLCTGAGDNWLMTARQFGDFDLRLEFRIPEMGNSGVAVRAPMEGNPAYAGLEIQILDDPTWLERHKIRPEQFTGSVYDVVAAEGPRNNPVGEWNAMRIVARGSTVTVELNGKTVVDADLAEHASAADKHPGLKRERGHMGLQNHGSPAAFRNIYVKPLD